jgi:hypothetical protein
MPEQLNPSFSINSRSAGLVEQTKYTSTSGRSSFNTLATETDGAMWPADPPPANAINGMVEVYESIRALKRI